MDQVKELTADRLSTKRVISWLKKELSPEEFTINPNGDFARVTTTVERLEALIGAEFWHWNARDNNDRVIKLTNQYSVPQLYIVTVTGIEATIPIVQS